MNETKVMIPTNHNLGFIHIYSQSQASILHVILPLIKSYLYLRIESRNFFVAV